MAALSLAMPLQLAESKLHFVMETFNSLQICSPGALEAHKIFNKLTLRKVLSINH